METTETTVTINREYLADAIWRKTYSGPIVGPTTIQHKAKSWSRRALEALKPPFDGARVAFTIYSKTTATGYRTTLWNPIPGMSAVDAFDEMGLPLTKLAGVIFYLQPK